MRRRVTTLTLAGLCLLSLAALLPSFAAAVPGSAWNLAATAEPANFPKGGGGEYVVVATNVGAAATAGSESVVTLTVPPGLEILTFSAQNSTPGATAPTCTESGQTITCKTGQPVGSGRLFIVQAQVEVPSTVAEGPLEAQASAAGGNAKAIGATAPTLIGPDPVPFEFLPGFKAPLTEEDGEPTLAAGAHPYQQTIAFGFPTKNLGSALTNDGHPKNVSIELPQGLVGSPAASRVLCTEAQLTGEEGCPEESQVGVVDVTSLVGEKGLNTVLTSNLYNMVPPPGAVAEFGTDVATAGVFLHSIIGVRSDGDYGIEAATRDAIAFGQQPIFNVQAQVWGDPSAKAHDQIRGKCRDAGGSCPPPVTRSEVPFLTLPGHCAAQPPLFKVLADTWEEPSPPFGLHEAAYASADLSGQSPAPVGDCAAMEFEPSIDVRPTTNLTDSPSGLNVSVHQPQETEFNDPEPPATLKDATIRFPAGLAVNASQAAGLGACSESQIGFNGREGAALRFSKAPQSCPAAAKIGTLEVTSPALVARTPDHEVEEDPEGNPVLEVLHGSIYVAQPFHNPFDSLIAVYLVVEDEKTGIVSKLAGEGELDPTTGQITTRFTENPELPLEDIRAHIFGGPRGSFITPPVCGQFNTTTDLVPWSSASESEGASPEAGFQTAQAPTGGTCPTTESQLPNAPRFSAGTLNPAAGKYSPLLFKLSREDGTQRFSRIETTLPSGLSAKLAGVGICSEADIAKAHSREAPEKGALEQADPSCPAASEIGVVNASAGAGPTPYQTTGHAYLAGPYKGAPVSIVTIAPAVAGPFDLGTVVVRIALYLDPATAQVRAVSDPLPTILQGVPLDVRQVSVFSNRPNFSLNPTSCAEKSFAGQEISTLGQAAPLSERFQVGGCKSLPYKPTLGARLFGPTHRGAHPRLRSIFTAKAGEANTTKISFALPKSEFIDQAHFRTICTRVQFAANQCPAGSVYGHVKAISPLLGYPLEGPIYLRSSSHKLPDTVLALHGPAYQPIFIEADGRVDSVNGGLRVRFESVPDAPLTKAIITTQGGAKGLFQNSTNICKGSHRATLLLDAQSGKVFDSKPQLKAQCPKGDKGKKKGKSGRHH
jgi:hypothetical protein